MSYDAAGKIGLQFKRRFWEQDDEIYGGRSWTDQEIGQVIYPSHGFDASKGVLVRYYLDFSGTMRERAPAERQRVAVEQGARIHPQYTTEFETAVSVSWLVCPGAAAHGGRNRPRRTKRSMRCAYLTAECTSLATT